MIQSKTHGDNWYRVGYDAIYGASINNPFTDNLQELLVEWCNEQSSQTSYCFVPRMLRINPRTLQPMPIGGEIWFEDQAMANWFTLRWS